jgi:hypothetical protein
MLRREFLAGSALALGAIAVCGCARAKARQTEGQMVPDYYVGRKTELLGSFDDLQKHVRPLLVASHGEACANAAYADARREFEALIPVIPYVGGDENQLTQEMVQSAMALALYRAMKNQGKSVEETGHLLYQTVEAMVDSYPSLLVRAVGFYEMSAFGQRKNRRAALESQKRLYPENWVFNFVEGAGQNFDWGIDYTECGIVKFFQAQSADELARYMCLADYPMSKAFGMGLVRTTTLAEGAAKCDFRFKRGRTTPYGWPPGFLKGENPSEGE